MRINALGNTATDFASDDYIVIDGTTNASRKMAKDTLLKIGVAKTIDSAKNVLVNDTSLNLFDAERQTEGYYINSSGNETALSSFACSDYIPVVAGETYTINKSGLGTTLRAQFYDIMKQKVAGGNFPMGNESFVAPSGSAFVRISYNKSYAPTIMFIKGSVFPDIFVKYNPIFKYAGYKAEKIFEFDGGVSPSNLSQVPTTYQDGIFEYTSSSTWKTSDYIQIEQNGNSALYFYSKAVFTSYFQILRFYDVNKNLVYSVTGGNLDFQDKCIKILPHKNFAFVRYAIQASLGGGIMVYNGADFDKQVLDVVNTNFIGNKNLVWVGTSIPEGAKYPVEASKACGYDCTNNSYGSSTLCMPATKPAVLDANSGKYLTATISELETWFRPDVINGDLTEAQLNKFKEKCYENSIIPYIDGTNDIQVDCVVIDHGFNDRENIHSIIDNGIENIDWNSRDRSNFIGAYNYLLDHIFAIKPFCRIVVAGYFQDSSPNYHAAEICQMQKLVAEHFGFPILDAWNYSGISFNFVAGTNNYLSDFNTEYGTSYTKMAQDANGNIPSLQLFCPDRVHPHSDKTGNCDKRLNAVYTKLLKFIM